MPTFFVSTADAAEAVEALHGLAHASRGFDQPAEMYGVIGDLSSGMRSLRQALDQIADVHELKTAHAHGGRHTAWSIPDRLEGRTVPLHTSGS